MKSDGIGSFARVTDDALVERFQTTADQACFEEIWRRYSKAVFAKCLGFLGNRSAAEDVASETFLKVMESLQTRYRQENFSGWLFTIARNLCLNKLKAASERRSAGMIDDFDPTAAADNPEFTAEIESALNQLSFKQRVTLKLFYVGGYSYEEIAEMNGWTVNDVKTYVQNGKRMFKIIWERGKRGEGL